MKFLVDAQLPARLTDLLNAAGHDAIHTTGLRHGNRSTDWQIAERADADGSVVVTKDRDFRDGHLLSHSPRRLLVVATGNITNNELLALVAANIGAIVKELDDADFVELSQTTLASGPPRASTDV